MESKLLKNKLELRSLYMAMWSFKKHILPNNHLKNIKK